MAQGEISEADTLTIRLGATPARIISDPPFSSPYFYAGCPSCRNPPNLSWLETGTKYEYAGLHTQWLGGLFPFSLLQPHNNRFTALCPGLPEWASTGRKKHSPNHHPDHHPIFISFFHLLRSIASSLFKLRAWQSFCTTALHVLSGLPLGPEPSTSYSIHFFTQSVSIFATHAHTIATCFAVVSRLYHLFLVFLSTPYLELSFP